MASLRQILNKGDDPRPFLALPASVPLTEGDLSLKALSQWVNPVYLQPDALLRINAGFCKDSSLQLHDFLAPALAARIQASLLGEDTGDCLGNGRPPSSYGVGVRHGWNGRRCYE